MLLRMREKLQAGPPRGGLVVIGAGVLLCSVTFILPWGTVVQARAALSSIGVLLVLLAQLRPATFWDLGRTQDWRGLFGDRGAVWLFTLIGLGIVLGAWLARLTS